MRILHHSELASPSSRVCFRNQSWLALFWFVALMWTVALLITVPRIGSGGVWWAALPALVGGLFFVLLIERLRLCRKPTAWLLRVAPEGLFINLRSYLNYHLPADSHGVLYIPREEIAAIAKTHETRKVPDRRGSHTDQYSFIDIFLNHDRVEELRRALRQERRMEAAAGWFRRAKRHDYPVRLLDPPGVRLVWDWVKPGEHRALDILGKHFPIAPDQRVRAKLWEKMSPEERESLILEFWEWGYVEDAVRMGKMQWNVGDFRAKKRLEEEAGKIEP